MPIDADQRKASTSRKQINCSKQINCPFKVVLEAAVNFVFEEQPRFKLIIIGQLHAMIGGEIIRLLHTYKRG